MNSVWAGVRKYSGHAVLIGCVISLVLTAVVCLREFLSQQLFNLVLGMLALPFVLHTRPDKKGSCRFAVAALLLMALSFYAPVNTLVYFALVAVLLYLAECHCGRINFLTLAVVILTMPLATYLVNTFSFPIRLWLASVCGRIFQAGGMPVEVAGNTFMYGGAEFTVDPACMGLNMLVTSFITGILLFGYYQKKCNREMPAWSVPAYLAFILVLNIFSNLVRMMLLVIFRVYPDTAMHDAVGIICMLAQVVLPAWLVCRFLIRPASPGRLSRGLCPQQKFQCGTNFGGTRFNPSVPTMKGAYRWFIQPACCVLLWVAALQVAEKKSENTIPAFSAFEGYKTTAHSRGIIKLESDTSLVYVKQIRWFCDTEHNPMTCWSGSGYQISQVQETVTAGGMTIYAGILQRGDDVLYTAWWYSNGPAATISQLRWRWDMLTGAPPYSLLNVTTADREALERETAKIARSFPAYGG